MSLKPTLLVLIAGPALAKPALELSLFTDARAGWQTAERGTPVPAHRAFERTAAGTAENGFSLAVVGLDATAGTDTAQAVVNLRFGPSIVAWHGNDAGAGLDNLLQGFVRWKPADEFTLDLEQFTTIYGAEVADSHKNKNYTRGALFWLPGFAPCGRDSPLGRRVPSAPLLAHGSARRVAGRRVPHPHGHRGQRHQHDHRR